MIDLLPSEEQQQIIDSVASFLENEMPLARLRPNSAGELLNDIRISVEQWSGIASMGWFGLGVAEALGGVGYTLVEEMLVARELGRYAISPCIAASMTAAHLAARAGSESLDLFNSIRSGQLRVAHANRLVADSDEYHLIDPHAASHFLVVDQSGARLYERSAFVDARSVISLDDAIQLERARLNSNAQPVLSDSGGDIALNVSLLNSAQLLGVAEQAQKAAVEYAKIREQFGQAIGSFQALKHRCADMATLAEAAYAQTYFAGLAQAHSQPGASYQAAAAKIISAEAALSNARSNIQIHGGIGFTAECDAHIFLKRAHLLGQLGGDRRWLRETLLGETMEPARRSQQ